MGRWGEGRRAPHCLGNWAHQPLSRAREWPLGTVEFRDGAGNWAEVTAERNYKYDILRHGKRIKSLMGGKGYVDGILIKIKRFDKNDNSWSPRETENWRVPTAETGAVPIPAQPVRADLLEVSRFIKRAAVAPVSL